MVVKLYRNSEIANMTEEQQELVYSEFEEDLRRSAELATAELKARKEEAAKAFEKQKRMIQKMFDKGMSDAEIAEVTELTVEEIQGLKQ